MARFAPPFGEVIHSRAEERRPQRVEEVVPGVLLVVTTPTEDITKNRTKPSQRVLGLRLLGHGVPPTAAEDTSENRTQTTQRVLGLLLRGELTSPRVPFVSKNFRSMPSF